MRLVILILLAVAFLGTGGYLGYMYFAKGTPPMEVIATLKNGGVKPDAPPVVEAPIAIEEEAFFLKMPILNVSVFDQGQVHRHVGIQVILEFPKEILKTQAEGSLPKLKDAMLVRLYHLARLNMLPTEGTALFLRKNILDVAQKTLGSDAVASAMVYATNDDPI